MKNPSAKEKTVIIEQVQNLLDRPDVEIFFQMDRAFHSGDDGEHDTNEPTGAMAVCISIQEQPVISWSTDEPPSEAEIETVKEINRAIKG